MLMSTNNMSLFLSTESIFIFFTEVLVSLFNCMFAFVGYVMPKSFLQKNSSDMIEQIIKKIKGFKTFSSLKVNVTA